RSRTPSTGGCVRAPSSPVGSSTRPPARDALGSGSAVSAPSWRATTGSRGSSRCARSPPSAGTSISWHAGPSGCSEPAQDAVRAGGSEVVLGPDRHRFPHPAGAFDAPVVRGETLIGDVHVTEAQVALATAFRAGDRL